MPFDFTATAGIIRTISVLLAILMTAIAGFQLMTNPKLRERGEWKEVIAGIALGLVLLFLAPLLAAQFTGGTYCG